MKLLTRIFAIPWFLVVAFACGQTNPAQGPGKAADEEARVQVLSSSQMAKPDADLLSARMHDVAEAARLSGYDLDSGHWIQSQVVCPDAPQHVLMHFLRLSPDGAVSLFTAVLPRDPSRVRVIPVLYHGAPAFHVFGSSPGQRDLINQVISTKSLARGLSANPDWTTLALCYAALAGAEPGGTTVPTPEETTPILKVSSDGKVQQMRFSVVGPDHLRQEWKVLFDRHTQVREIELSSSSVKSAQSIPASSLKTRPVPPPK